MKAIIETPHDTYRQIRECLLPPDSEVEEAGFIFAEITDDQGLLHFRIKDWYHAQATDFDIQTAYHIALKDDMRPRMIKRAHDLECGLIEVHSHLGWREAEFSASDLYGFSEFVPHIRWRLGKKPYAALVFAQNSFDALIWHGHEKTASPLTHILTTSESGSHRHMPTGHTLRSLYENGFE